MWCLSKRNQAYAKHLNSDGECMITESFVGMEALFNTLRVIEFCSLLASTWVGHHVESYLLTFYLYFSVFLISYSQTSKQLTQCVSFCPLTNHIGLFTCANSLLHKNAHTHLYTYVWSDPLQIHINICRCMCVGKYVCMCAQTLLTSKHTCIYAMWTCLTFFITSCALSIREHLFWF